ncbi:hypothetical protein H072_2545 [Dactylellina haptotyla CBS 200.50]|uniref:C3H1-type domain-containing protein n=1 Tax=Dactylellina haptotyla (strain CBS 200.50) TaxID=1284197 RepID=S8C6Z0_DACHA|nr:hypothetical protein H072_2545 [Dactylellina haptotyla CBS 200.50]
MLADILHTIAIEEDPPRRNVRRIMVLFDDGDAALLKKWVVNRLENISDADSDVLADYVLALLRHEQSEAEVRQMCIDQLDDFLREHTTIFVNELFAALRSKSYLSVNSTLHAGLTSTTTAVTAAATTTPPAAVPPPVQPVHDEPESEGEYTPKSPEILQPQHNPFPTNNNSKKRGYYDRDAPGAQTHGGHYSNARNKNPKTHGRGGNRAGRDINNSFDPHNKWARGGGEFGRNGAVGPHQGQQHRGQMHQQQPFPMNPLPGAGGLPIGAPPLPFGTDPMTQLLAVATMQGAWNPLAMFHPPPHMIPGPENRPPKKRGLCHSYEQKGFCRRGDSCPYLHANPLVVPPVKGQDEDEYDPHTPMLSPQELERRASGSFPPTKPPQPSRGGGNQRGGRGGARGGRSEFAAFGPARESSKKALVIESIPEDKLDDESVRGYFLAFGGIESIEVKPEKKLAIVRFENAEDAKKAHSSPEPIFNNRFVKVYWMKGEGGNERQQVQSQHHQQGNHQQPQNDPDEMEIDIEDFQKKQDEAQKAYEEKQAKKKEIDDQAKRLEELQADLLRRQEEEKKKLLAKLAKKHASKDVINGDGAEKTEDNEKGSKEAQQTAALKAQLEALEAEATSLGIDHSSLDEPLSDFVPSSGYRGRGSFGGRGGFGGYSARGAYIPRGRGAFGAYRGATFRGRGATMSKKLTLDNRTKTVMVNGVSDSDVEALQQYMLACGSQYSKLEKNYDTEDSHIITFNTRGDAARFYHASPVVPQIGKVEVSWVETNKMPMATVLENGNGLEDGELDFTDSGAPPIDPEPQLDQYDVYDMADGDDPRWT